MNFDDSKSSQWKSFTEFFQDRTNRPVILLNIFSDKLWRRFSFIPRQRDYSKRFIWLLEFCFSIIPFNIIWTSSALFTTLGEFIISIWRNFTQCLFSRTVRKRIAKRRDKRRIAESKQFKISIECRVVACPIFTNKNCKICTISWSWVKLNEMIESK